MKGNGDILKRKKKSFLFVPIVVIYMRLTGDVLEIIDAVRKHSQCHISVSHCGCAVFATAVRRDDPPLRPEGPPPVSKMTGSPPFETT